MFLEEVFNRDFPVRLCVPGPFTCSRRTEVTIPNERVVFPRPPGWPPPPGHVPYRTKHTAPYITMAAIRHSAAFTAGDRQSGRLKRSCCSVRRGQRWLLRCSPPARSFAPRLQSIFCLRPGLRGGRVFATNRFRLSDEAPSSFSGLVGISVTSFHPPPIHVFVRGPIPFCRRRKFLPQQKADDQCRASDRRAGLVNADGKRSPESFGTARAVPRSV